MKKGLVVSGAIGIALLAAIGGAAFFQTSDLDRIHSGIAANYDTVEHLSADDFSALSPNDVVLFDVREPDEFAVSHLAGAILVEPEITEDDFAERFADKLQGKRAVFYCSVGARSSILADRVAQFVERESGKPPVNLIGGLFQWRNDGRALVSASSGATEAIHPFDDYWGRLIEDEEAISYSATD
ncbi:MAG: rhodanese-like domain-containing protein [Erythrobacter sp.]|uniref:rhodanese-like domain-containing protein n=1 Tax=Erythrobacter sp. TaxID=1042 RepID=UPI003264021C